MSNSPVDWVTVKALYASNTMSLREIGAMTGVSHVSIGAKAKREGWVREPREAVKSVLRKKHEARVKEASSLGTPVPSLTDVVVESVADEQFRITMEHREHVLKGRALVQQLFRQLEDAIENRSDNIKLVQEITAGDPSDKRRSNLLRALGLQAQSTTMMNLSNALKNLVVMERTVLGIEDNAKKDGTININVIDERL